MNMDAWEREHYDTEPALGTLDERLDIIAARLGSHGDTPPFAAGGLRTWRPSDWRRPTTTTTTTETTHDDLDR